MLTGYPSTSARACSIDAFNEAEARNTDCLTHKLNLLRAMHRCAEAHARERHLIALFGRHDQHRGPLTNQTDGGEGASNPSEGSRERRRRTLGGEAEDEERRVVNRWFQSLCNVRSVPVKPLSGRFRPERLYANRSSFDMSARQAAALVASAIANRVLLSPGAVLPRLMSVDGVAMAVENGVGRDILSSGLAHLADTTVGRESLALTPSGFRYILFSLCRDILEDAGVLLPDLA